VEFLCGGLRGRIVRGGFGQQGMKVKITWGRQCGNPTLSQKARKDGPPVTRPSFLSEELWHT